MTTKQKIAATRWALVPVAAILGFVAAFFVAWPLNRLIHLVLWSSGHYMPGKLFIAYVLPYDGAIAASLFLLFGCLMAPTHRQKVAATLLFLGGLLAWAFVGHFYSPTRYNDGPRRLWWPIIGTYLGGLATFVILCVRFPATKSA